LVNEAQLLLINRASVRAILPAVRAACTTPIDEQTLLDRFRANLVVDGCEPFDEDTWTRLRIGRVELRVGVRDRCTHASAGGKAVRSL
jgi:uncharacterized protein YcbX